MHSAIVSTALFAAAVMGHGAITTPPTRQPGQATAQACGTDAVDAIQADVTGPIENIPAVASADCNPFLCKGVQFADNTANVQQFAAGDVINFEAVLPIPHEGPCNVSIVDTATNTQVGQPLIVFDSYADENLAQLPANNTAFSVTMPNLAAGQCAQPGECTMQWFWFGTNAQQTYEDCVDFVAA